MERPMFYNLNQLQVFILVAEQGSFTKAAELLRMTQPAASWQIKSLEKQVGMQLLERGERRVVLTDAGKVMLKHARGIVDLYRQAQEEMDAIKGVRSGHLVLGASTIPGEYILPQCLGQFRKKYPGIDLSLRIADTTVIVESVLQNELHLGVVGAGVKNKRLTFQPLLRDNLILISYPGKFLNMLTNLDELSGLDLIIREPGSGTRMFLEKALLNQGIELSDLNVVMELGSTRAVISAVEADLGVSFVSRLAAAEALALGRIQEVKVEGLSLQRQLYIVSYLGREESPAEKKFKDFLLSVKK